MIRSPGERSTPPLAARLARALAIAGLLGSLAGCRGIAGADEYLTEDTGTSAANEGGPTGETAGAAANHPPQIAAIADQTVDEGEDLNLEITATDDDGDPLRVFARGLPPGARWDEPRRRLEFTPDAIQGGDSWTVTIRADDGQDAAEASFAITVRDTIRPPPPVVVAEEPGDGFLRLRLHQPTDSYLDSPGYAGRVFDAIVSVPSDAAALPAKSRPVRVVLHGLGGSPWEEGWAGEFRIAPHDPMNSYWWGYAETLPEGQPAGRVAAYTGRRVLHLLEWVLREFPGADPERVYIEGASMGGAGALTLGLLHGRHFAWVSATIGQAIPRNHRPSRLTQLAGYWGNPALGLDDGAGENVWDRMDLTRALLEEREAREQLVFLKHGKDDPLIHFGAVVHPSPLTGRSLYQALQDSAVGHLAVWDEGGHGSADPLLGDAWWQGGWNPIFDAEAVARRDLAFPAFRRVSTDRDPGDGGSNGLYPWDPERGYAGSVAIPGDTGWNGELAGALGRGLRWDHAGIIDRLDRFEIPLRAVDGDGGPPPAPGYPTVGDRLDGALPVVVDVTLRRIQGFQLAADEPVHWRFGPESGEAAASSTGELTIYDLSLRTSWETLVITREAPLAPG